MRQEILAVLLIALIIGCMEAGYVVGNAYRITTTATQTSTSTTVVVSTYTTSVVDTTTQTTTTTSVPILPSWLFVGAYAYYSGTITDEGTNYTEDVRISVFGFTQTNALYNITSYFPSGEDGSSSPFSVVSTKSLSQFASAGLLLCAVINDPQPANVSASGLEIPATGYSCIVAPDDYGTIYLGTNVPFILSFYHFCTVCAVSEEWKIAYTNIIGLM